MKKPSSFNGIEGKTESDIRRSVSHRYEFLKKIFNKLAEWQVEEKLREILPHIGEVSHILDIGTGNGVLCRRLRNIGHRIMPLDVQDKSFISSVRPRIYNGQRLPFDDKHFDISLLIAVLHHIPIPEKVVQEAKRVSKRIIIMEETFSNIFEKYVIHFVDSLFNLEFVGHSHSNKTDMEWKKIFQHHDLKLSCSRYSRSLFVLQRVTYVLETGKA